MNNKASKEYKRRLLVGLINIYLSKPNLKMKDLMRSLVLTLNKNKKITLRQFNAVYKFIERERPFKAMTKTEILNYFSHLIVGNTKETNNDTNTLF